MSKKIVLAGACRTAIGKMGGALSNTPAADLGAIVIKEALNRAGVKPEQVDEVLMGCVIQAAQGQNVARQASIKAGLPIEVPAVTLNVVCGSGLNCVNQAAAMIKAGMADIVVAGGMENMSMAPYALTKARFGYRMNDAKIIDTMTNDALTDAFNHYHMMITAENICDKYGLTREKSLNLRKTKVLVLDQLLKHYQNFVAALVKKADWLQLVMLQVLTMELLQS